MGLQKRDQVAYLRPSSCRLMHCFYTRACLKLLGGSSSVGIFVVASRKPCAYRPIPSSRSTTTGQSPSQSSGVRYSERINPVGSSREVPSCSTMSVNLNPYAASPTCAFRAHRKSQSLGAHRTTLCTPASRRTHPGRVEETPIVMPPELPPDCIKWPALSFLMRECFVTVYIFCFLKLTLEPLSVMLS